MEHVFTDSEPESSVDDSESYSVKELYDQFPSPFHHFKVAVYIRYQLNCLNPDYLKNTMNDYDEMFSRYSDWTFVDYYIDNASPGTSLSELESWSRLMADCENGKVDLIFIGSAFLFELSELYLCVRFLASLDPPVGVFFEEQNLYSISPGSLFLEKDSASLINNLNRDRRRKR